MPRLPLVVSLALLVASAATAAAPPVAPDAKQRERLAGCAALLAQAQQHLNAGREAAAVAPVRAALQREREVYGHVRPASLPTLAALATLHRFLDDWDAAVETHRELVATLERLHGQDSWRVVLPRVELADAERLRRRPKVERDRWVRAERLAQQVRQLKQAGQVAAALKRAEETLAARKEALSEKHPAVVGDLNEVVILCNVAGDYARALRLGQDLVALAREALGEGHPHYAHTLRILSGLYVYSGRPLEAVPLIERALPLRRRLVGERSPEYVVDVQMLAAALSAAGRAREGLAAAETAVRLGGAVFGTDHVEYANSLGQVVVALIALGEPRRALEPCRQELTIRRARQGERHPQTLTALNNLAMLYQLTGAPVQALPILRRLLTLRRAAHGPRHPLTIDAVNNLGVVLSGVGDYRAALPLLREAVQLRQEVQGKSRQYAGSLHSLAALHADLGDYRAALPLARQAVAVFRDAVGEKHPEAVRALLQLGALYDQLGDNRQALAVYQRADRLAERDADRLAALAGQVRALAQQGRVPEAVKLVGPAMKRTTGRAEDPAAQAQSAGQLADLHNLLGDPRAALAVLGRARERVSDTLGKKHPRYHHLTTRMAVQVRDLADHHRALLLAREALALSRDRVGEQHPEYAADLALTGVLIAELGDYVEATRHLRRAMALCEATVGRRHATYLTALKDLVSVSQFHGEPADALELARQAEEQFRETLGVGHIHYASALNSLARLHQLHGEPEQAAALARRSLHVAGESLGENDPRRVIFLHVLANAHAQLGDLHRAIALRRQALAVSRQAQGDDHPHSAAYRADLGMLLVWKGARREGEALLTQAVESQLRHLESALTALGERQRLAAMEMARARLHAYLGAMPLDASRAYEYVVAYKGMVTARQAEDAVPRDHPELADLLARLRATQAALARLASSPPAAGAADRGKQFRALQAEKERLEEQLGTSSAVFRLRRLDARAVAAALSAGAALVDFVEYVAVVRPTPARRKWQFDTRLTAFVVRPGRAVVRVELGDADAVRRAVEAWHRPMVTFPPGPPDAAAAATLRRLVWSPLEKHLAGCGAVVVAPDGPLCGLPFAALPGGKPGSYLLEDVAVTHVSSARQLAELAARRRPPAAGLLALGGADYGPSGVRGWVDLPGTRHEARRLAELFRSAYPGARPRLLEGRDATRPALLRELQGGRPRWLHLATHGYFRPPAGGRPRGALLDDVAEMAFVYSPQLLCGVVLAGANRDPGQGTLTAEEVGALDLRGCELVVISACETGLGKAARGEGLLGLQRAFHIAGGDAVLASLWQVPDDATRVLMERFYEGLWQKKLPRAEALRQAQLWLLRQGPKHPEVVRGVTNPKTGTGRPALADGGGRLHPFFWAAWVLSGDLR